MSREQKGQYQAISDATPSMSYIVLQCWLLKFYLMWCLEFGHAQFIRNNDGRRALIVNRRKWIKKGVSKTFHTIKNIELILFTL